jgi:hypothetical protein
MVQAGDVLWGPGLICRRQLSSSKSKDIETIRATFEENNRCHVLSNFLEGSWCDLQKDYGNGYPLPAYPLGKYPLDVRVWDKKIPMSIQIGKIYTHRVEWVWVWDPKTHTRIPRYPSNSLICGPSEYQRTKLIRCYYAQVWLFTRMCCCSQVYVVAYNMLLLNYGYMLFMTIFLLKLMCCKCGYFYPRVPIYPSGWWVWENFIPVGGYGYGW